MFQRKLLVMFLLVLIGFTRADDDQSVNGVDEKPELFFNDGPSIFETSLTEKDFSNADLLSFESVPLGFKYPDDPFEKIYKSGKFEGDIIGLDSTNITDFIKSTHADGNFNYNAVRNPYSLWPNGVIPYTVSSSYSAYARAVIAGAINTYHTKTCIKFVPRTSQVDYVFISPAGGCYSMVGRFRGQQLVSLGQGCIYQATVEHELMHATGFFHEQSRADRDNFIKIQWQNVIPGTEGQFLKYGLDVITHLGIKYDYGSVMHYGPTAFSKNGLPTIIPQQPGVQIGQRQGLSPTDIRKINKLYECRGYNSGDATTTEQSFTPTPSSPLPGFSTPVIRTTEEILPTTATTTEIDSVEASSTADRPHGWTWWTKKPPQGGGKTGGGGGGAGGDKSTENECRDLRPECTFWKNVGHCRTFFSWMTVYCSRTCESCTSGDRGTFPRGSKKTKSTTTTVEPDPNPEPCRDSSPWCPWWSRTGFCFGNFNAYMRENCGFSCNFCSQRL